MKSTDRNEQVPSRFNGQNVAGIAFLFFSFLFLAAGTVDAIFALIYPVDYLLVATGVALLFLGYRSWRQEFEKMRHHADITKWDHAQTAIQS